MSLFSGRSWTILLVVASAMTGCNVLLDNEEKTLTQEPIDGQGGGAGESGGSGHNGDAGISGVSGHSGGAGMPGSSGQSGGGEAGAAGQAGDCEPTDMTCTCGPFEAALRWDGGCYMTQRMASGDVTLRKTHLADGRSRVVLSGELTIADAAYGYTRHELPPGFMPVSAKAYACELQEHETLGDASKQPNFGAHGVGVRRPDFGYHNAVLWFPQKWAGKFTLHCTWETEDENTPGLWSTCASLACL